MLLLLFLPCLLLSYNSPSTCSKSTQYYNYLTFSCQQCPTNTYPDPNRIDNCLCSSGYYHDDNVVGFLGDQACKAYAGSNANTVFLKRNFDGSSLQAFVTCAATAYPNQNRDQCIPCPRGMNYNSSSGTCECITGNKINDACRIQTYSTSAAATSFVDYADRVSQVGCKLDQDQQSCQMLLNMCASQGYDNGSSFNILCNSLNGSSFFPSNRIDSSDVNLDETGLYVSTQQNVNVTDLVNTLNFYLAVFDMYGAQIDFKPLEKQLFKCESSLGDTVKFQSFGNNMYKSCTVSLSSQGNYFYDMYLKTSKGTFAQIPVKMNTPGPFSSTIYVKRFTLWTDLPNRNTTSTTVNVEYIYPTVNLNFKFQPPLLTPYLTISSTNNPATISNTSEGNQTTLTLLAPFIVICLLTLGVYIYQMVKYVNYNPNQEQVEIYFCARVLWNGFWIGIRTFAVGLWLWLFGVALVCFCFYKFQKTMYFTLPDPNDSAAQLNYYKPFENLFYIVFSFSVASSFELVWRITKSEYFMIDWEKPGFTMTKFNVEHEERKVKTSIWRKLFVVNQLYQLSVSRLYSIEITLLFVGLFLEGLDWVNLKYMVPSTAVSDVSGTENIVLSYFINSFLYLAIALGQIYLRRLVKIWWSLPAEDFVDLCCLSNISIFILDDSLHGYYIHGRNPLGKAEGSLQYIDSIFEKESQSIGRGRGLIEGDEEACQTFEIVIPRLLRLEFNKIYLERLRAIYSNHQQLNAIAPKAVPDLSMDDYDTLQKQNKDMANAFRIYLEEIKKSLTQIATRNCLSDLWSCPPDERFVQNLPIFFKDSYFRFTQAFLCGNQVYLLLCDITIFNFWFIILKNTYQAIFLTWVCAKLLFRMYQEYLMKRNLASNTMVDDKFFI